MIIPKKYLVKQTEGLSENDLECILNEYDEYEYEYVGAIVRPNTMTDGFRYVVILKLKDK